MPLVPPTTIARVAIVPAVLFVENTENKLFVVEVG